MLLFCHVIKRSLGSRGARTPLSVVSGVSFYFHKKLIFLSHPVLFRNIGNEHTSQLLNSKIAVKHWENKLFSSCLFFFLWEVSLFQTEKKHVWVFNIHTAVGRYPGSSGGPLHSPGMLSPPLAELAGLGSSTVLRKLLWVGVGFFFFNYWVRGTVWARF